MAIFVPAIMSGGSGTRLWPVSRQSLPKQFAALFGDGPSDSVADFLLDSLFAKAVRRLQPFGSPWTITVADMKVLTEKTLAGLSVPAVEISRQTLYEPRGRNTAAAIALLCRVLETRGASESVVGVFPADQLILDEARFQSAVREAIKIAENGEIVTLGIHPTFPATGYGYIETAGSFGSGGRALKAVRFREKPDVETAKTFLAQGSFLWNAGMFIFRASKMIELLKAHAPKVWEPMALLKPDLSNLQDIYEKVEAISIDFAVMERLSGHVTIPCDFDWSDVGSWDAIAEIRSAEQGRDGQGRDGQERLVPPGQVVEVGGAKNFVLPHGDKTYAFVGTEDIIVVDTQDATLIAKRGHSEKVKDVVDRVKAMPSKIATRATQHPFEIRPWGKFEVLRDTEDFKSKTILVDAGAKLSLQSHAKRAEHWIIVRGEGEVVLNDEVVPVGPGSHVFIPVGAKHRMHNTAPAGSGRELVFVEIQLGTYFGEDDIVRYEDSYGRK